MAEETEQITEMESDTDVEETTVEGAERPEESPLEQAQNAERLQVGRQWRGGTSVEH